MARQVSFDLLNEDETMAMGAHLAKCVIFPAVFTFRGSLGAGKTTLVRAIISALGITGPIKSPTFSIVESYQLPEKVEEIHHFDLYRIEDETELEFIGFRDYFSAHSICCIEWPERALNTLLDCDVDFSLATLHHESRVLKITALTPTGEMFLSCLSRHYA